MTSRSVGRASRWTSTGDVVDFVERITYEIWHDYQPDLVTACYVPQSVIWGDAGDLTGNAAVTANIRERQAAFPDYRGVISDVIWTGDDQAGYRTSMRWISRGTHTGPGPLGPPTGRPIVNSCIANCVVREGLYLEEWGGANSRYVLEQLGLDIDAAAGALRRSQVPAGAAGWERTRGLGVTAPAIPARVAGAGAFVTDLLDGLYNRRDLSLIEKRYAPGAPYSFGVSRWNTGHAGVRREVGRWLDLVPDLSLAVEELYWNDDGPCRSRVAVR